MSTAHGTSTASERSVFKDEIQRRPEVCSNCFRITHEITEGRRWFGELGWIELEYWLGCEHTALVPHARLTAGEKRACGCGVHQNSTTVRPLSKHRALSFASNLADTLEELGVDFDREALIDTVRAYKSDPDHASRDDAVFDRAVTVACHRAPHASEDTPGPHTP